MREKKTKEQLLKELIQMQKDIDLKVKEQNQFINRFQMLINNEGLFSQVIDNLPYPIAIFDQTGVLKMANKILLKATCISKEDLEKGRINLINRITNDYGSMLEAMEDVFLGETTTIKELSEPLSLFAGYDDSLADEVYQGAVFFPLVESSGHITYGVVMLMK